MNIHKHILLLGAGFTKNFGGFLGSEMWARIFNDRGIQGNEELRKLLLRNWNYEEIYSRVMLGDNFPSESKKTMANALQEAYQKQDEALSRFGPNRRHALFVFVKKFVGADHEKGFAFSLNQDLLFERYWNGSPDMVLPGLRTPQRNPVYISQSSQINGPFRFPDRAHQLPDQAFLQGNDIRQDLTPLSYIKLHGSQHFMSAVARESRVMVVGHQKDAQIAGEPLLDAYFSLFREVLMVGNVKLLIYGYGFLDKHINHVLKEATRDAGLKTYLINPTDPFAFFENLSRQDVDIHGIVSLAGYFQYTMLDHILPENGDTNFPGWADIQDCYFNMNQ